MQYMIYYEVNLHHHGYAGKTESRLKAGYATRELNVLAREANGYATKLVP